MRMLDALKKQLPQIQTADTFAYNFILSIVIQREIYPDIQLTGRQFSYLIRLQNRFCYGGVPHE